MIAEEAGEAVDDHEVERRRFRRPGLDKPLELWTAVVRRRRAGLNIGVNDLEATRRAPAFALPPLVGARYVMLGLPSGRDATVEGRARPWDGLPLSHGSLRKEIGRASCRERACQYVKISVVAVQLKKKKK